MTLGQRMDLLIEIMESVDARLARMVELMETPEPESEEEPDPLATLDD